jgi:hypothetical protein
MTTCRYDSGLGRPSRSATVSSPRLKCVSGSVHIIPGVDRPPTDRRDARTRDAACDGSGIEAAPGQARRHSDPRLAARDVRADEETGARGEGHVGLRGVHDGGDRAEDDGWLSFEALDEVIAVAGDDVNVVARERG